ncbi:MAG: peptidylprolyl isomerase [Pseudohongiellaceae bacterium]
MTAVTWRCPMRGFVRVTTRLVLYSVLAYTPSALAETIVRISTGIGDYSIELLDDVAPITVQNFLAYVNRNAYNGTYIHRAENNFVVQGGGFRFRLFEGPIDVPADPPIQNEFSVSNTRGTIAMAKLDGDPNSATSQWFVNLIDNSSSLDTSNGGFTVFGTVLGDGMITVDAIDALPTQQLGVKASNAPFITPTYNGQG